MRRFSLAHFCAFTLLILAQTAVLPASSQAQTFTVIHSFNGGGDGATPYAGVTIDRAGNLYGTNTVGGLGSGVVYKLAYKNSSWLLTPLYTFLGGNDGADPRARVIIGPNGTLYGTTAEGGGAEYCYENGDNGCGTVFNLRPSPSACKTALCAWSETIIYRFQGSLMFQGDGDEPDMGDLIFDAAGNIYGTTQFGGYTTGGSGNCGSYGCGVIFELSPSGGRWNESVLYAFQDEGDGVYPRSGVILDSDGNLYGTVPAYAPFTPFGAVYELSPSSRGWTFTSLYQFYLYVTEGLVPYGGLIFDRQGNLYGTTITGDSPATGGTVFELSPSNGSWEISYPWGFSGSAQGPYASLTMDASGSLYGTTYGDGAYGYGNVFELTPSEGGWVYTSLYDFTGGSDGANPIGGVTLDANGNLYGTTSAGGSGFCGTTGCGVVWEIAP